MNSPAPLNYLALDKLLMQQGDPSRVIAYCQDRAISWSEFILQVEATRKKLNDKQRWLLVCDDAYWFAVGFFALLHENKKIVLPANSLPKTLAELPDPIGGVLTDQEQEFDFFKVNMTSFKVDINVDLKSKPVLFSALNSDQNCIELFTSGSTGQAKKIEKSLTNLNAEIKALEALWGGELQNSIILSTVSQQHIYGLLFRLLWPLCAGRAFVSHHFEYPEMLLAEMQKFKRQAFGCTLVSSPAHLKRMPLLINIKQLKGTVKRVFSSGGPLSYETAIMFNQQAGQSPMEIFGSTETGGIAYREQAQSKEEQAWQTFNSILFKCQQDNGLLLVRTPYINKSQDINKNEWFVTDDRIKSLSENQFLLCGRIDRVVKIEEKRLSLPEMEQRLQSLVWVAEAKLIFLTSHMTGSRDQIACAVVLTPDGDNFLHQNGVRKMSQQIKQSLSDYYENVMLPRKWRYVKEMPFNQQGKTTQANLAMLFIKEADE